MMCDGNFSDTIDCTVNLAPGGWGDLNYRKSIKISIQKASKDGRFLCWNSSWKKPWEGERIHYCQEVIVNFTELYYGYNLLDPIPFLVRGENLFVLSYWPGCGWNDDEIGVITVILTCEIVITGAIVGTWLLTSHVKNPPQPITAQHVMIAGEVRLSNWRRKSRKSLVVTICKQRSRRVVVVTILLGAKVMWNVFGGRSKK